MRYNNARMTSELAQGMSDLDEEIVGKIVLRDALVDIIREKERFLYAATPPESKACAKKARAPLVVSRQQHVRGPKIQSQNARRGRNIPLG
jgi:hypothetical protein